MPDAPSPPPAGIPPHLRGAVSRYRALRAGGCDAATALAELVAYLVVLRPGLPRVLAHEQAEAVAAACGPVQPAMQPLCPPAERPAHPPHGLLVVLARPARPENLNPSARHPAPARPIR
ncbi:hypothetical protein E2C06_26805 [Dankookia rubra]|uniref:Uncharacterized protein n=1 Tax=Dankookia rubra TaxID=1442381 RepID=A0A4R5QB03_9PROT|nr:hypothetical protein [Dankookia rubra]TDH59541.1 hypothetical protein E2C06_26805 [Dankookia rubra]